MKNNKWLIFTDDSFIDDFIGLYSPKNTLFVFSSIRAMLNKKAIDKLPSNFNFTIQPPFKSEKYKSFIQEIKNFNPSFLLSCSYSMIVRDDILSLVENNAFNIHSSILPKNRGPNPIQWGLIKGENEFGFTVHRMTSQIDQGAIIYQKVIESSFQDTWLSLSQKINREISSRLGDVKKLIESESYTERIQEESDSSKNFRLTPDFPEIDFDAMSSEQVYNLIRAQVSPLNGAFYVDAGQKKYIKSVISLEEIEALKGRIKR